MSNPEIHLNDPFIRGLACAALSHGLRRVLVFDLSPADLRETADILSQMLAVTTGHEAVQVALGTVETDDDLWGNLKLPRTTEDTTEELQFWSPGLLTGEADDPRLRLISIPDLTRLSLPAARALVMLADASVAHLERHGQHLRWQPNLCWLAGCASEDVEAGVVSPHLLDRFALRLNGRPFRTTDRAAAIKAWASDETGTDTASSQPLDETIRNRLQSAAGRLPAISESANDRLSDYISASPARSPRRYEV